MLPLKMHPEVTHETNNLIYIGFIWFNEGFSISIFKVYQLQRKKNKKKLLQQPNPFSAMPIFSTKLSAKFKLLGFDC